jgi:hypothetical protein
MRFASAWRLALLVCAIGAVGSAAAQNAPTEGSPTASKFIDPDDGWFDVSGFLDTVYGFVPVVVPITEPAVGYGAAGALVFIDRDRSHGGRPNLAVAGGLGTENGTRGLFAGHLGTWKDNRLRTLVFAVDADVNLEFFGLGGDRVPGETSVGYAIALRGATAGASYRVGDTALWVSACHTASPTQQSRSTGQISACPASLRGPRPDAGRAGPVDHRRCERQLLHADEGVVRRPVAADIPRSAGKRPRLPAPGPDDDGLPAAGVDGVLRRARCGQVQFRRSALLPAPFCRPARRAGDALSGRAGGRG